MTITADPAGLADLKQFTRATWAVGERIVQRVGIGKNERVLDVACGTGNAAIRAAQAGGQVVGLDLTPELFETGRRLAADASVSVEWIEGDAEAIPYPDNSFDVVFSTFGCMFAPRHRVAAFELARVLRPGGRLGLCNWTPEGSQGHFFRALGAYLPRHPTLPSRHCCGAERTTSPSCSREAECNSSSSATRRLRLSHSRPAVRQSISSPATSVRS
jgi:ubiquinone/menaquinone biosynthesis C-methylase UbiE